MTATTLPLRLSGPITGGKRGWPFGATMLNIESLGYVEEEYFFEGTATSYRLASGTDLITNGHWQVEAADNTNYKTRMLVYRPKDSARFNGTVVVTWNNVTAGYDLFNSNSLEILEAGFALVCVTVQKAGIEGIPPVRQGLAAWDSLRYESLSIPSDDFSYDIFTQAAKLVGAQRDKSSLDPLDGLEVHHVVAQGASQSASRLATYINAIAPKYPAFDGFMLTIYFGKGAALEVGETVVDISAFDDGQSVLERLKGVHLLRDDLDTPIFVVNSELEAIACYDIRQPDSDTYRYWEVAGTCHVSRQNQIIRQQMAERDELVTRPQNETINAIPMNPVFDAALHHMHQWLIDNIPPPIQPLIEFTGDPVEVSRDEHGIALGGIRLPQANVPLAQNSALSLKDDIISVLGGSSIVFSKEKIQALYSKDAFLEKFEQAAHQAVKSGVLRPREIGPLVREATETWDNLQPG